MSSSIQSVGVLLFLQPGHNHGVDPEITNQQLTAMKSDSLLMCAGQRSSSVLNSLFLLLQISAGSPSAQFSCHCILKGTKCHQNNTASRYRCNCGACSFTYLWFHVCSTRSCVCSARSFVSSTCSFVYHGCSPVAALG